MWACLSAHVDQRRNGRCLAVVPVLLLLGMGMSSAATAAQWPTTQWVVQCAQPKNDDPHWSSENCAALNRDSTISFYKQELEASSRWLEDLGFKAPKHITGNNSRGAPIGSPDGGDAFVTKFFSNRDFEEYPDPKLRFEEGTLAKHSYYGLWKTADLFLRKGEIIAPSDARYQNASAAMRSGLVLRMGTPVHELFHGVQVQHIGHATYRGYQGEEPDKNTAWIIEGSAEAVMRAWLAHRPPVKDTSAARHVRYYSDPLYAPDVSRSDDYDSADFWLSIGRELGSRQKITYLKELLDDLSGVAPTRVAVLKSVDQSLARISAEGIGLYDLYPRVIAHHANRDAFFREVENVHLQGVRDHYPPDLSTGNQKVVKPVAAHAYRLTVQVPEGKSTELEVAFTEDHPNLHLIVDDQRLDAEGAQRNVFRKPLEGRAKPYTFFVRAANVAPHAADTKKQAYELNFALKHPLQDCEFIADVSGAISGHFEGKATVGFDTGTDGRTAKITDLTLESDRFNLKVGLRPPAAVGEAVTAKGDAFPVASSRIDVVNRSNEYAEPFIGPRFSGNEMQKMFGRNGDKDFVSINVHKSDVIPWGDLPIVLRRYLADTMGEPEIVGHGEQVGDVTVKGVVEGQLSQTRLIKGLAEKNQQIHFRARFKAQSEIYECDYDGFAEKMNRRMSRIPSDAQLPDGTQMPKQMKQMRGLSEQVNKKLLKDMSDLMPGGAEQMGQAFDKVQDKMSENMPGGMSERTKKQVQEQLDRIKEQMKKAQEDGS